jgi:hypothetical protein
VYVGVRVCELPIACRHHLKMLWCEVCVRACVHVTHDVIQDNLQENVESNLSFNTSSSQFLCTRNISLSRLLVGIRLCSVRYWSTRAREWHGLL